MTKTDDLPAYIPARNASAALGVPESWLMGEAKAGRLPFIAVGRRRLFDVDQVREALRQRAEQAGRDAERAADAH